MTGVGGELDEHRCLCLALSKRSDFFWSAFFGFPAAIPWPARSAVLQARSDPPQQGNRRRRNPWPRIDEERTDQERIDEERIDEERTDEERIDEERIDEERTDQERIDEERIDEERIDEERTDQERIDEERTDEERIDEERCGCTRDKEWMDVRVELWAHSASSGRTVQVVGAQYK
jgi:hypothetical protein